MVTTKRALAHFAVDTEEAHMTTRLAGSGTVFLPFNFPAVYKGLGQRRGI